MKRAAKTQLLERQGRRCFYCPSELVVRSAGQVDRIEHLAERERPLLIRTATIDHFIPLSKGGADARENMVLACACCNDAKAARLPTIAEMVRFVTLFCVRPSGVATAAGRRTLETRLQLSELERLGRVVEMEHRGVDA